MTDKAAIDKSNPAANWEGLIKLFLHRLEIPTKEDILFLHQRLDKLEQLIYQKTSTGRGTKSKTVEKRKTASSVVMDVISSYPKGTNFKTIKAATGFNDKKLRNIIFRLDKIKKIKRVRRGIYKKV
ncbi:MAG: hypothetical protein D3926_17220 [Desulfobacteraceae bacterium]|nr:MAG: hypothetical protein D3926_17220 [Desulfobacteraceae bacterium]